MLRNLFYPEKPGSRFLGRLVSDQLPEGAGPLLFLAGTAGRTANFPQILGQSVLTRLSLLQVKELVRSGKLAMSKE